ncbi:MAG: alternative ribosome rescue aminoacyl-tRNA hydrolase ArfB [Candidatus Pedobacter colombiensis]|uniref:Alternative ribosome rescue aminoacyl-tRNA hydrolase ArfB n=1 Tax=Candidatus Pedobacter colombiensis TaxID=3121371 RepID=A0AAJ5W952_9SPHI|nr:alternative ribosome rescue aminoacyl-tRNA hydrolase ArfB [Pedobacter sp.]WEK20317.1 MAG: alternative ribosome rescue aminoacyl-tRNA hydrolase ArfB [Pedobacter sp.]
MLPTREDILKAVTFKTSRSGGKGGQNVNKVSSKVELIFNIAEAYFFTDNERTLLTERLAGRIDQEGNIHVVSQEDRSQLLNKEKTIAKLIILLKSALHVQKKRKTTKIPKAVIRKRLADKQSVSAKKESRKRPQLD